MAESEGGAKPEQDNFPSGIGLWELLRVSGHHLSRGTHLAPQGTGPVHQGLSVWVDNYFAVRREDLAELSESPGA